MEFQHDTEYLCRFFDTVLVLTGIDLIFFHSSLYGLMFGICDENSDDFAGVVYLFIPEQCLHSIKIFSAPQTIKEVGDVQKSWEENNLN